VNISAPFIARPVATILLTFGVALCGIVAFTLLPVAPLPKIDAPAIFVSASLPGASPEVMASSVATPLERHLGAIADVDDMTSRSSVGSTNIQLTFGLDRDIDGAARDVQAAIVASHADLPSSLTRNPSYRKLNSSLFPVLSVAMTSDVLTQGQIYDAADAVISQRCRTSAPLSRTRTRTRPKARSNPISCTTRFTLTTMPGKRSPTAT
jgi:multidrug efflux pump